MCFEGVFKEGVRGIYICVVVCVCVGGTGGDRQTGIRYSNIPMHPGYPSYDFFSLSAMTPHKQCTIKQGD